MNFNPGSASIVCYVSDIERTGTLYKHTIRLKLQRMDVAEPFCLQGGLEQPSFVETAFRIS